MVSNSESEKMRVPLRKRPRLAHAKIHKEAFEQPASSGPRRQPAAISDDSSDAFEPPPDPAKRKSRFHKLLNVDGLAVNIEQEFTSILHRLFQSMEDLGISSTGMQYNWTPQLDVIEHFLNLPLFDIARRHYKLLKDEIELYEHETVDGMKVIAWRVDAINTAEPDAKRVNLFIKSSVIPKVGLSLCPLYKEKSYKCSKPPAGQACTKCIGYGPKSAKECIRRGLLLRTHGHNLIAKEVCSEEEKDKVVDLGRIKVDVMNRVPEELDVDKWSVSDYWSASHIRVFIDITSLVTWKQLHNPEFDLATLPWNPFRPKGFHGAGAKKLYRRSCLKIPAPRIMSSHCVEQSWQRQRAHSSCTATTCPQFLYCYNASIQTNAVPPSHCIRRHRRTCRLHT